MSDTQEARIGEAIGNLRELIALINQFKEYLPILMEFLPIIIEFVECYKGLSEDAQIKVAYFIAKRVDDDDHEAVAAAVLNLRV
jgi:hypothetical protein